MSSNSRYVATDDYLEMLPPLAKAPDGYIEMLRSIAIVGESMSQGAWTDKDFGADVLIARMESEIALANKVRDGGTFSDSELFRASGFDRKGNLRIDELKAKVKSELPAKVELLQQAKTARARLDAANAQLCEWLSSEKVRSLVITDDDETHCPPGKVWLTVSMIAHLGRIKYIDEAGKTIEGAVWISEADLLAAAPAETAASEAPRDVGDKGAAEDDESPARGAGRPTLKAKINDAYVRLVREGKIDFTKCMKDHYGLIRQTVRDMLRETDRETDREADGETGLGNEAIRKVITKRFRAAKKAAKKSAAPFIRP